MIIIGNKFNSFSWFSTNALNLFLTLSSAKNLVSIAFHPYKLSLLNWVGIVLGFSEGNWLISGTISLSSSNNASVSSNKLLILGLDFKGDNNWGESWPGVLDPNPTE